MNKPLRLVIVEDSARDFELILRQLRQAGYDPSVERVQTEPEMATALDTGNGTRFCRTTRCRNSTRHTPCGSCRRAGWTFRSSLFRE